MSSKKTYLQRKLETVTFPQVNTPNYIDVICSLFSVTHDISYSVSDPALVMDSYVEICNNNINRPVLLAFHAGGGDKLNNGMVEYCEAAASRGYKAYSVNYGDFTAGIGFSVSEQKQAVANACACIRWIRSHAVVQGINPLNIFIVGESAGSVTGYQTVVGSRVLDLSNPGSPTYNNLDPEYNTYFNNPINSENNTFSSIPTAAGAQSGAINSQIDNFISAATHPIFFINGDQDCTVYYSLQQCGISGALENYNLMKSFGIAATFTPLHGSGHGISSYRTQILEGGLNQVVGVANPVYASNTFTNDIGIVRKFSNLLQ